MAHHKPIHHIVQKFASTRPGAWFGSQVLHHFDRAVYQLSGGQATLTSYIAGLPMLVLTTTGAKSGLPRITPLLAIRDGVDSSSIGLIASNWGQDHHPGWYHNLKANPCATCVIDGVSGVYRAREAIGEEYEYFWQRASQTYFGYTLYKQRVGDRRIPIMVLQKE